MRVESDGKFRGYNLILTVDIGTFDTLEEATAEAQRLSEADGLCAVSGYFGYE